MFTLEHELESLAEPRLAALIARERREVFSLQPEVRVAGWAGATLLATAAGIVLKNNLERIGPLALAVMMGIAAAACYAFVWWRRERASIADDYVLLLGALLVSADVAFIETQFHLFGAHWKRHLLLLAVLHGATAYAYRSRMLLSLSIAALAGWLGVDRAGRPEDLAIPAFLSAACVMAWRELDRRLNRHTSFTTTFDHFAANLAFAGGLALLFENDTRTIGTFLTIALAAVVIAWALRMRRESFALYAVLYAVVAIDVFLIDAAKDDKTGLVIVIASIIGSIAALLALHARFRELRR